MWFIRALWFLISMALLTTMSVLVGAVAGWGICEVSREVFSASYDAPRTMKALMFFYGIAGAFVGLVEHWESQEG